MTSQESTGIVGNIGSLLTAGEETIHRLNQTSDANPSTQQLRLTYFTARKTETITQVRIGTGATAAAATPTKCLIGAYSEAPNGDLTLLASIANDTALFAAANTEYLRSFTSSWPKRRGLRYAIGLLVVSAAATPSFRGFSGGATTVTTTMSRAPRISGFVDLQTSLPGSIPAASIVASAHAYYMELLP